MRYTLLLFKKIYLLIVLLMSVPHATCLQVELYCVNQAHNSTYDNVGEFCA